MVFIPDTRSCSKLYFLRHGLAGQHGDPKYKDDSLRPLTLAGEDKMRRVGQGMKALGLKFDIILSSPYLRARQTAETVARAYKIKSGEIHITKNLLYPGTIEKLLKEVRSQYPKCKNVLFVGHEPHLSELVSDLLSCTKPLAIDFKKGGLCCLSIGESLACESAVLNWLLTPAQLVLLSREKQ